MVWEYYNDKKEVEMIINHTTGKLYSLKEDTTNFVVFKEGAWIDQKFRTYPIPVGGYSLFYHTIKTNLRFPREARMKRIDGQTLVMFEVDSIGYLANLSIVKDPGGGLGSEVVRVLREHAGPWIQAQANNQAYRARFILPVTFGLGKPPKVRKASNLPHAKMLEEVVVIAIGVDGPGR